MSVQPAHPVNPLQPGERLGVWRLQLELAEVPSGRWWRAVHSMGQQPAWVLVYDQATDAGAVLLRMAQAEGEPWQHPDLAWPLDSGLTADGRPYVVQPLLDGQPLMAVFDAAPLRQRLQWVMQLCELLLLARSKGLALIELDPSLLWVGMQQQLRLHALALVRADAQNQRLGSLQGQISHAAQPLRDTHQQAGDVGDERAQVFAVGTLMCLLVNGRLPHQEPRPQSAQGAAAPKLQALGQWLSLSTMARGALDALLHDAVQADPARRPADLHALATRIDEWLQLASTTPRAPAVFPASVDSTVPLDMSPDMPITLPQQVDPADSDSSAARRAFVAAPSQRSGRRRLLRLLVLFALLAGAAWLAWPP